MAATSSFVANDPRDPQGERQLDVDFTINSYGSPANTFGPPEYCDPGEAPEITLDKARDITGADVLSLLSTEQYEAIETEILENYDFDAGHDYWDGDY